MSMEVDTPQPSLLERVGDSRRGGGSRPAGARRTASAPYQKRRDGLGSSNADADGMWKHDKHDGGDGGSLASRLQEGREVRPRADLSAVQNALRKVNESKSISIKGASLPSQPIVEVRGLVSGTTPEDVKAIFQSCGPISKAHLAPSSTPNAPHVLLYYETRDGATSAVNKFNGLPADGQKLSVMLAPSLSDKVLTGGKNEDLLPQEAHPGKLYSDQVIASDPRAQIISGDFNATEPTRGVRGRGRRGRGGRRVGTTNKMDTDRR